MSGLETLLLAAGASAGAASAAGTVGTIFSGVSLIGDFMSSRNQAKAQEAQGIYDKNLADQNAGQIQAESQLKAREAKHRGDLVASSAKAKLASGGGQASDPTAVDLIANIEARSAENALNEMYSGNVRADAVRQGGQMAAYQGRVDAASTRAAGMSSLIGGAGSLMAKYGGGGPSVPKGTQAYTSGAGGIWPSGAAPKPPIQWYS